MVPVKSARLLVYDPPVALSTSVWRICSPYAAEVPAIQSKNKGVVTFFQSLENLLFPD